MADMIRSVSQNLSTGFPEITVRREDFYKLNGSVVPRY